MRFAGGEETALQREIVRKVEIGRADTAGKCAAEGSLEAAGTEGKKRFRIGEEEAGGDFVLSATKFAVPIGGELVVGVFSRLADNEGARTAGGAGNRGDEEPARAAAELVALEIQEGKHHGINVRACQWKIRSAERGGNRARGADRRKHGKRRVVDLRARRKSAALASALIVHEEEAIFFPADGTAQAGAKDILLDGRTLLASGVQEKLIRVQNVVAEILVDIAVKILCA